MNIKADPTEFAGKRVLISGGSKGLGRATVDRFWLAVDGRDPSVRLARAAAFSARSLAHSCAES